MKVSKIKQIIKEEVVNVKTQLLREEITTLNNEYNTRLTLYESVLGSIMALFLEPKARKKAEAIKTSAEYKELEQQIKVSSEALEQTTKRLKKKIDEYESLIKGLQNDGIDVKMGDSMDRILQKTKQKHKDILKKYKLY
jgi:CHASE1-domain containing sensor protein